MAPPNLLDIARKLNDLVESSINIPKKGAEKISLGSETAANSKTLTVRLLEVAEIQNNIPAIQRNPFAAEDEDHWVERALVGANTYGFKVPEFIEAKLDKLAKSMERIERVATMPSLNFNFRTTASTTSTPSNALAASKHAPKTTTTERQPAFNPVTIRKSLPAPPPAIKSINTLTFNQTDKDGKALAKLNYPTPITTINCKLANAGIKELITDEKTIRIWSVHHHLSNNIMIYPTTEEHAPVHRDKHEHWVYPYTTLST